MSSQTISQNSAPRDLVEQNHSLLRAWPQEPTLWVQFQPSQSPFAPVQVSSAACSNRRLIIL